ncbi:ABC transporter permease [Nesterenkonia haasae]|uniref:ABC transporter permease n=1 Tax=Nesterenkonia haasae TaxID=2587813 RepID=UPI0013909E4D|nr:ABC transporter permease [Nesterenkonia haasae]NDK31723.1 ABC transporter permease [Nesterenkonia haasae]
MNTSTTPITTKPDGSTSPAARALADTWTITLRDLQHWRHMLGTRIFNWVWPIILMTLFLGLMGGALGYALGGSYLNFVMPGVLAMTVFLGLEGTMAAVSQDSSRGVTDRFRSLPMSGIAVVGGRCIADLLDSLVSLTVVFGAGLIFGWRPDTTGAEALAVLGLLLLLRVAMLWTGIFVGLKAPTPESLGPINMLVWPILFFSSVFVDTATMPRWLGTIADANPLSATATTVRELLGAPMTGGETWFAEHASTFAVVWPGLLIAIFLPLAVSTYRHLRS